MTHQEILRWASSQHSPNTRIRPAKGEHIPRLHEGHAKKAVAESIINCSRDRSLHSELKLLTQSSESYVLEKTTAFVLQAILESRFRREVVSSVKAADGSYASGLLQFTSVYIREAERVLRLKISDPTGLTPEKLREIYDKVTFGPALKKVRARFSSGNVSLPGAVVTLHALSYHHAPLYAKQFLDYVVSRGADLNSSILSYVALTGDNSAYLHNALKCVPYVTQYFIPWLRQAQ